MNKKLAFFENDQRESITINARCTDSYFEFAEDNSEDKLIEFANSKGIMLPHPSLAIFSSILCEIEESNGNGVRLGEDATVDAVDTIVGCQINFEHARRGNICGYIIGAKINIKKEVEIIGIYFKDIYGPEYERAKDKSSKGKLTMSFEISADKKTQDILSDGTRRVNEYYFTGAALLLDNNPACDKAVVQIFAKQICSEDVDEKRMDFIFAKKEDKKSKIIEAILKSIDASNEPTIAKHQDYEIDDKNKLNEVVISEQNSDLEDNLKGGENKMDKEKLIAELGVEITKDWKDEDFSNEEKIAMGREELAKMTIKTEKQEEVIETLDTNEDTITVKSEIKTTYTYDQVEEIKSKLEKELTDKYENEISELKETLKAKNSEVEEVKINAEKIGKLKTELKDNLYAKDFTDEDYLDDSKVELAKTQKINSETIEARKEELKDNEFAKDFTDEDYLSDDKVELAKVKAENVELIEKAKVKEEEKVVAKVEESTKKVEVIDAGYIKADIKEETSKKSNEDPLIRLMKSRKK